MTHGAPVNYDQGERKSLVLVRALLCLSIIACGLARHWIAASIHGSL
jgi:hypothetical protein